MADPKFKVGDSLMIMGKFRAKVLRVFPNFKVASEQYERSFQTICKVGPGYNDALPAYLCQIENNSRAHIGTTEGDAQIVQ